jgi:peptidyl-prolyl cis-trans isomerase A (cyclophilin A)
MKGLLVAALGAALALQSNAAPADCKNHPARYPTECCTFTAPDAFNATFVTDVGNFTVMSERKWSPYGVDRWYGLLKCHYFDDSQEPGNNAGFFRVVTGFVVQWGIAGLPAVSGPWVNAVIPNDPVILSNVRGTISYAAVEDSSGQACNRTTQIYINYADNSGLDGQGFTPYGKISDEDMKVVDKIYAGYAQNPDQDSIYANGDAYLKKNFPKLSYTTLTVLHE